MKIKTFEGNGNNEVQVNEWLEENPDIEIIDILYAPMYELYYYNPSQICNQWILTTVIYKEVK